MQKRHSHAAVVEEPTVEELNSVEPEVEPEVESEEVLEEPKVKIGDKTEVAPVATTTVDSGKKPRAPRIPKNVKYRILEGVDVTKFSGQRAIVIRTLQSLLSQDGPDSFYSPEEIASLIAEYPARVDKVESVTWHLRGMLKENLVAALTPASVVTPAVTPAA
jgi:hypothetical protein